ncbi:MAG TPA: lysoplasmalogenase [Phnomibacter sp.]|nr:lysoplasmalogenase [Phnomibacter sp.]
MGTSEIKIYRLPGFVFLFLLLIDVLSLALGYPQWHQVTKPLLMPALASFLFLNVAREERKYWGYVFAGLLFSWVGDVLLQLEQFNPIFFLLGLASFLITHVCYIWYFRKLTLPAPHWWRVHWWAPATIFIYGVLLVAGLLPNLKSLTGPVIIYAAIISLMVVYSLRIQPHLPGYIWIWLAMGAFMFLISDSILALNKFHGNSDFAPSFVMLTYGMAQYFIVLGTIRFCRAIHDAGQAPAEG